MIHRTARSAYDEHPPIAGWKDKVILKVTLKDGREFYRTYTFDATLHKCKRCRNALIRQPVSRWRQACTGHICEQCGNPYASFVRKTAYRDSNGRYMVPNHGACYGSTGRLH
jgi:hypothetical protein